MVIIVDSECEYDMLTGIIAAIELEALGNWRRWQSVLYTNSQFLKMTC